MQKILLVVLILLCLLGCSTSSGGGQATTPQVLYKITFGDSSDADPDAPHRPQGWGQMTYDPKSGNLLYDWEVDGKQYHGVFEPKNKFTVRIKGELAYDPQTRVFTYTYQVNNLAGPQSIGVFTFENQTELIENNNDVGWGDLVTSSPSNPEATFAHVGNPIAPGQTGVFVLKSLAPPGIVVGKLTGIQIQPYVGDAIGDRGDEPTDLLNYHLEVMNRSKFAYQQFHMPAPAPVPEMTAGQFVDRLIALKNQSVAYKWLTAGLSTQLDALLGPVKQAANGSGDLPTAVTRALTQLEDLNKRQPMKTKLYMLIKGNLLYLTGLKRSSKIYVPRYPAGLESCRENMETLGIGVESYYKNYGHYPAGWKDLLPEHYTDRTPKCPIDGVVYGYQCENATINNRNGYTIFCRGTHDGGKAGGVYYTHRGVPTPAVDLNKPGNLPTTEP